MRMKMSARYALFLTAALLSPLGCGGALDANGNGEVGEELTVPSAVANMVPAAVVESTGNLYWTRNSFSATTFRWSGQVYRTGKTSSPGQEIAIYSESGTIGSSFGDLCYANVNGVWYGYFLATSRFAGTQIKRVPLDGSSPAVSLGQVPAVASSRLLTDGTYLFYYDANALYAEPIGGGSPITVAQVAGINTLGFDRTHLFFSSGSQVYWAFKPNFGNRVVAYPSVPEPVTSLFVVPGADNDDTLTTVTIGTTHMVLQESHAGLITHIDWRYSGGPQVNSVSAAGSRILFTYFYPSTSTYYVAYKDVSLNMNNFTGRLEQSGARSIMGDASNMFYVDNYALERLAY